MNLSFHRMPLGGLIAGWIMPGVLALAFTQIAGAENQMASATSNDRIVATIDGEPVSSAEYRLVMLRQSAGVFAYFKEHHGLEDKPGYWKDQPGVETPIAMLREVTLKELAEIKVCQKLALEKGLLADASFQAFQMEFTRENERRRRAATKGGIVYGPSQYREAAYYYIRHGDLLFRVKNTLAREAEPEITEEMISDYREAHEGSFGDRSEAEINRKVRSILSQRRAEEQFQARMKAAKIEVRPELRSIAPRTDAEPEGKRPGKTARRSF